MKTKVWMQRARWFLLGACSVALLIFIVASDAQSTFVKLMMRLGEERVLEDGTKIGLTKGDGDLIVVTISRPVPSQTPPTVSGTGAAKLGSYKFVGSETSITDDILNGFQQSVVVRVKLNNIDRDGNVTAEVFRFGNKGLLKGTLSSGGILQLDGFISANTGEQKFTLTATVGDKNLTNGKYTVVYNQTTRVKGSFNVALLEED